MVGQKIATLRLYRRILTLAKKYPSIKREAIIQDIRTEFRENRSLEDPEKIAVQHNLATQGLEQLKMFTELNPMKANWSVDVAKNDPFQGGRKEE